MREVGSEMPLCGCVCVWTCVCRCVWMCVDMCVGVFVVMSSRVAAGERCKLALILHGSSSNVQIVIAPKTK